MCAAGFSPGTPLADAVPAQAAPWGEIRRQPSRTDPEPRKNAVSVGVKNISAPSDLHPLSQEVTNSARGSGRAPEAPAASGRALGTERCDGDRAPPEWNPRAPSGAGLPRGRAKPGRPARQPTDRLRRPPTTPSAGFTSHRSSSRSETAAGRRPTGRIRVSTSPDLTGYRPGGGGGARSAGDHGHGTSIVPGYSQCASVLASMIPPITPPRSTFPHASPLRAPATSSVW